MQQNAPQTNADPADVFVKRRRTALWCSGSLFGLSVLVLVVGLLSATHTDNVAVSGYYPGIILSFGAFLGVVGLNLVENRRPMVSTRSRPARNVFTAYFSGGVSAL
ncbi:transmembrane protein 255B [Rhinichthys klamathensis goyatoka]|uniref:transmembrane protein 255B n=1 Tax=Rhinichthys klamathensis goyatoka TaxID=3034132 RepID=UPI0024B4F057|nr:transmembrane protein 255B [Rhinichthys klamathensis goyatoka]